MIKYKWSSYSTEKAATVFRDSIPSREFLRTIAPHEMSTEDKVDKLKKYVQVSVYRKGAFFHSVIPSEIDDINFYEIIRRYKKIT